MKKLIKGNWLLILLLIPLMPAMGEVVPVEDARVIARNLYFERVQHFRTMPIEAVKITGEYTLQTGSQTSIYIFNIGMSEGFVLVSAEDLVYPVLGYAFEGQYRPDDHHPSFAAQMELYERQILDVRQTATMRLTELDEVWERYLRTDFTPSKGLETVGPICKTRWDQGSFYNDSCPGNSVTGCVATAMGQIMKAFNWPPTGKGSYSYTHPYYGVQSANFGSTNYKWSQMPDVVSSPNASVAQLLYHCGVSVDMNYSPGGSGASMYRAADAFYIYFRYSPFIRTVQKNAYSDIYWKILIRAQHMNGRPVLYSGPGHAFVCDGFQYPDHFHFNWGWGGSYDGYYYMTSLRPGNHNYTNGQDAIIENYPDSGSVGDLPGEGGKKIASLETGLHVYPNPYSNGLLNCVLMNDEMGEVIVDLRTPTGQLIQQWELDKNAEWVSYKLDVGNLDDGVYLIGIHVGSKVMFDRLVICKR